MLAEPEAAETARANATGLQPVMFAHGLWLLPCSWDRWMERFEESGYTAMASSWPESVETTSPTIGEVADRYEAVIAKLDKRPVIVGHSVGGLVAEILAGRGAAAASVAIAAAPFRGALPLPITPLRSLRPAASDRSHRNSAVPLTYEQFRFAFANAVGEREARVLFDSFAVPACRFLPMQASSTSFDPWPVTAPEHGPERRPLLVVAGTLDRTVPPALSRESYESLRCDGGLTEYIELTGRGHSLTIDSGWIEVADVALSFVRRVAPPVRT